MPKNRFNFTQLRLEKLEAPPAGARAYVYDETVRGLCLTVYGPGKKFPSGKKTFSVYQRIKGRPERVFIGPFPQITVDAARDRAREIQAEIARGENPADKMRAVRGEDTLSSLFERYLTLHAKVHKKTWKYDEWQFNQFLEDWKSRKIGTIRRVDVQSLHSRIGETNGTYTANRLLALLSTMFTKAKEWGWEGKHPAKAIRKFPERSRKRFIQGDEIPRFFAALSQEKKRTVRDYFLISLLTGARKSNALAMRWDEVNLDRATWTIPETKNGESQVVTLADQAVAILRARLEDRARVFPDLESFHAASWRRIRRRMGLAELEVADENIQAMRWDDLDLTLGVWRSPTGRKILPPEAMTALRNLASSREFVFPSDRTSGHLKDPKAGWQRLLERAELDSPRREDRLRIHDLRRSLGSWQTNTGASLVMVSKALGHLDARSTQVYARISQDPVRESVQRAVDAMFEHGTKGAPAEVIDITAVAAPKRPR